MHTITLQRRHRFACLAKHKPGSLSTEAEEHRKNWKKCKCKIYAHGTLQGKFHRLATHARDWDWAREVIAPYLAAGSWDITPPDPSPGGNGGGMEGESRGVTPNQTPGIPVFSVDPREGSDKVPGTPIGKAVQAFLQEHKDNDSARNTVRRYGVVLGQLGRWAADEGLRFVEEWTPGLTRRLRAHWLASNCVLTVRNKISVVKSFFEMWVEDELIATNPARIKFHKNVAMKAATGARQVSPFTDQELERMLAGARTLQLNRWPDKGDGRVVVINQYGNQPAHWTGEDVADFVLISVHTGLRISDMVTFNIDRLVGDEVRVRAMKNGHWVSVWIPEWLRIRIRARAARLGPFIFGRHTSSDVGCMTQVWRRKLNRLWKATGPWAAKPKPHRFRHTFIRILLERHVEISVIAELVGDTEQMIRKHYSDWVPGRQESVSRALQEAFRNVPRYHY